MLPVSRTASIVLVPVTSIAAYAAYVRWSSEPTSAHAKYMKSQGVDSNHHSEWRAFNKGLGVSDVGHTSVCI
ncbi:hypothetical protein BDB01DRAFT_853560 [Pilobolus umbonatus]|nr:hypothetical protein BDB01DRAFT_853560 [Pilobolus umbonatus]